MCFCICFQAALCDGLPAALDDAPYSFDTEAADLSIQLTLHAPAGDRAVRLFLTTV